MVCVGFEILSVVAWDFSHDEFTPPGALGIRSLLPIFHY